MQRRSGELFVAQGEWSFDMTRNVADIKGNSKRFKYQSIYLSNVAQ